MVGSPDLCQTTETTCLSCAPANPSGSRWREHPASTLSLNDKDESEKQTGLLGKRIKNYFYWKENHQKQY
jgi:hypothetical protein